MNKVDKITTLDIELAIARLFNPRVNIIVPNVTWGMGFNYELDMLVITPAGYGYEIEIKISKSDFLADMRKRHFHDSKRIKKFYYAIPDYLLGKCEKHIPNDCGIISVNNGRAIIIRESKTRNKFKFTPADMLNLTRLGTMRIWALKRIIRDRHKIKYLKKSIEHDMQQMNLFEEKI